MTSIRQVKFIKVEQLLEKHDSNIKFDNYDLPKCCPKNEFECYKVKFEKEDINRIYLVGNFSNVTNGSCKLEKIDRIAVLAQTEEDRGYRIKRLMDGGDDFPKGVNLLEDNGFELVLVGKDLQIGGLLLIDGSHRAIAHYLNENNVQGIPAYVCIHKNIITYSFYGFIANI